jgi:hypothetical protein
VAGDPGGVVQFEIRTPLDGAAIRAHIQSALSRGLDEVEIAAPRDERLTIVANGPSALDAPLTGPPGPSGPSPSSRTLAINNALRLFVERGHAPDYWMASDPQACVADYLHGAPRDTVYLVASKCHPAVFDALRDRRVVVWHCAEPGTLDLLTGRLVIQSSITVTLCALNLMPVLGFCRLDTWGWDGCYLADRDHAAAQPHHRVRDITLEVGPGQFATTASWAAEAQESRAPVPVPPAQRHRPRRRHDRRHPRALRVRPFLETSQGLPRLLRSNGVELADFCF